MGESKVLYRLLISFNGFMVIGLLFIYISQHMCNFGSVQVYNAVVRDLGLGYH